MIAEDPPVPMPHLPLGAVEASPHRAVTVRGIQVEHRLAISCRVTIVERPGRPILGTVRRRVRIGRTAWAPNVWGGGSSGHE